MPGGDATPGAGASSDLDGIRAELEEALGTSSLRSVARAVGMSPSGLAKVLAGGQPYRPTLAKLRAWRVRRQAGGEYASDDAALDALLRRIPERSRARVREEILAILERGASGR
jgi:transcriptional regulator with XRE-family HTH domain